METSINLHSGVLGALSMVGGVDGRPRIGGFVVSDLNEAKGTVCRISRKGKLVVEFEELSTVKKLSLPHCRPFVPVAFNLDGIPLTDTVLDTWANLLCESHGSRSVNIWMSRVLMRV